MNGRTRSLMLMNGPVTDSTLRRRSTVQVHLRLFEDEAASLRRFAEERDQGRSAFVRFLLRRYAKEAGVSQRDSGWPR
jgi:hypothetical protein